MFNDQSITVDLRQPWGVSPFAFGSIQIIWGIMCSVFFLFSSLSGHSNFTVTFVVALTPLWVLTFYEVNRNRKWGWVITAVSNAALSNRMIVDSKPIYRTIFGYNRRELAPIFSVKRLTDGRVRIVVNMNGCPNADSDLTSALQRELSSWLVVPDETYPVSFMLQKRRSRGRRLSNADFNSSR